MAQCVGHGRPMAVCAGTGQRNREQGELAKEQPRRLVKQLGECGQEEREDIEKEPAERGQAD